MVEFCKVELVNNACKVLFLQLDRICVFFLSGSHHFHKNAAFHTLLATFQVAACFSTF